MLWHKSTGPSFEVWRFINREHHLLPIAGKVVDLRNGEVLEREKEHLFTIEIPIEYAPDIDTTLLESALMPICCERKALLEDLQTLSGLILRLIFPLT